MASTTEYIKESYGLWIDGAEVPSVSGDTFDVLNPADDSVCCKIAEAREEDIAVAVESASVAFEDGRWSNLHARERGLILIKAAEILRSRIESIAHMESIQTGRAIKEMKAQLGRIPEWLEFFGGIAQGLQGSVPQFSDNRVLNYLRLKPLGVCALITPWNHPLLIAIKKVAPALAAGNTIVVKPSELAPVAVIELARILGEAGLPPGVMNVVPGFGATAGKALCEHPTVRKLDLTGGTVTGRLVAAQAGKSLIPCVMELGGNAPVIIFDDSDLTEVVNGIAFAAYVAAGQTCISAKRIIVQDTIYEEFKDALVAKANSITLGLPADPETQLGPVVSKTQMNVVLDLIETARTEGATISAGGGFPPNMPENLQSGYYIAPTVITDVKPEMTCFQEEIFGPVITIVPFSDEAEAISLANNNKFGLGAAVWTKQLHRGHRVAQAIDAGIVWLNTHHRNSPDSPWGGIKDSGMGKENGWEALRDYTWAQSVVVPLDDPSGFDWFGASTRYS